MAKDNDDSDEYYGAQSVDERAMATNMYSYELEIQDRHE